MHIALLAIFTLTCPQAAAPAPMKLRGTVVDSTGKPVANALVGSMFLYGPPLGGSEEEPKRLQVSGGVRSNDQGEFVLPVLPGESISLATMNDQGTLGAFSTIAASTVKGDVRLQLKPFTMVTLNLGYSEPISEPPYGILMLSDSRTQKQAYAALFVQGADRIPIPSGSYDANFSGTDSFPMKWQIEIPDRSEFTLPRVNVSPTTFVRHFGMTPPEIQCTDAKGFSSKFKLTDLRGKWVIVDFWGYWCGPCVAKMPFLMSLYDKYASTGKFEILAFHDPQAKSFEHLEKMIEKTRATLWKGRDIPFPILLDTTGETVKKWGILAWPTTVVVDPTGKLMPYDKGLAAIHKALSP